MHKPNEGVRFKNTILSTAVYLLLLLIWEAWQKTGNTLLGWGVAGEMLGKIVLFGLFPWALLARQKGKTESSLQELLRTRFPALPCLALCCTSIAFLHTVRLANGLMNTHVFFDWTFVLISLVAGVSEEIAFRGWLYNMQAVEIGEKKAAALNSLLFLIFHYPTFWVNRGYVEMLSLRGLLILGMGLAFCWMFSRWKSLALNLTVHTVWDITSYLFALIG